MTEPAKPVGIVLTVQSGPCAGVTATVFTRQATIGRDADCDLALPDDVTVSRRHASLTWEAGRWVLRDLGSKNGTFFQGALEMEPRPLHLNDSFTAGSARISLAPATSDEDQLQETMRVLVQEDALEYEYISGAAIAERMRHPYPRAEVEECCREILGQIHTCHATGGRQDEAIADSARRLTAMLLPAAIAQRLAASTARPLSLMLSPQLLGIPWELLYAGEFHLGLARPVARQIVLEHSSARVHPPITGEHRILIVANPTGDLPDAQEEGEHLFHRITRDFGLEQATFLAGPRATAHHVLSRLEHADVAIYLGHAVHDASQPENSGWQLADGLLRADRLRTLPTVPRLVVASACESARETLTGKGFTISPEEAGTAAALLLSGVEQYVGTLWPVPAVSGATFGAVYLNGLLGGAASGSAMLLARRHLRESLHAPLHVPLGYVLYGNPHWRLRG
jgi:CHAT domain-containing protein